MGRRLLTGLVAFAMIFLGSPFDPSLALATSPNVVISQVYGGGGNTGALYNADFVELFNRGTSTVTLTGWSIQYASATGTGNFGANSGQQADLTGAIAPGQYLLIRLASGTTGAPLPAADIADPTPINMSGSGGKVALVNSTTSLGCNGGSTPCSAAALATIVDLIGYDGANFFEGLAAAPTLSNTTAALRNNSGCQDTDNNGADFTAAAPTPRNSTSPLHFCDADVAPTIAARAPAPGAAGVAVNATISVTFSEPVTASGAWYAISCATSGTHAATVTTSDSVTYVLDPDTDFASVETCQVTVFAANITDTDANDPPDLMATDTTWSFDTIDSTLCGDPATRIHDLQGSGLTSQMTGSNVTVEGVVVGDYQGAGQFTGYYVQEEDADADADVATSEGVFVFSPTPVSAGDLVRIRGTVTEFTTSSGGVTSSLTELGNLSRVTICAAGAVVTPATVTLPVASYTDFERYEGMLVHFDETLTATETFTLARFGEVRLAADGRLYTPTAVTAPGAAAIALEDANRRRSFVLDDGNNQQNIDPTIHPVGGLSATNTLRSGYTVDGVTGVFDHRFGAYRLQPVGEVPFAATNPRTAAPASVGGNTRVASFNVLNYFNGNGTHLEGAAGGFPTSRGATSLLELDRQTAKEVSALRAMNADIVGLMEIENDAGTASALADLVAALNAAAGAGTYAYVDTGVIGTDEIKVALIYKPASVTPVGAWKIITSSVDPRFIDTKNRPSLAQTFQRNGTTEKVTVVVNHLKSKGSGCEDVGDPDTGDGQGNCNVTRANAAAAIVDWLATDPTSSGSPNFLLIGDMNSYTFEDPIRTFEDGGFTNMVRAFGGLEAYSYVFNGESGYLDHALATTALAAHVTGAVDWHINADEPVALDYNTEFKSANQVNTFYDAGPYRSSDHDPVVIGLDLRSTPTTVCALTRELVAKPGIADSLCAKLDAATAALARGNENAARNQIAAYVNEVRAQRGKAIEAADADILIALAGTL